MKKIIALLLAAALLLSLYACSKAPTDNEETPPTNEVAEPDATTGEESENSTEGTSNDESAGAVWKMPTYDIYANYPADWIAVDTSGVLMIMQDKSAMTSITYCLDDSFSDDPEKVIAPATKRLVDNAYAYCEGRIAESSVEVTSTTDCTMGGFDCKKLSGVIPTSDGYDCHVYGYSFVIDGVGIMVCGMVTAQAQDTQMIADIDAMTDQIAASIRTSK